MTYQCHLRDESLRCHSIQTLQRLIYKPGTSLLLMGDYYSYSGCPWDQELILFPKGKISNLAHRSKLATSCCLFVFNR